MLKKSKITGKYYSVDTLSSDEKLKLGFDKEIVENLKKVDPEQKKSRVKKRKEESE